MLQDLVPNSHEERSFTVLYFSWQVLQYTSLSFTWIMVPIWLQMVWFVLPPPTGVITAIDLHTSDASRQQKKACVAVRKTINMSYISRKISPRRTLPSVCLCRNVAVWVGEFNLDSVSLAKLAQKGQSDSGGSSWIILYLSTFERRGAWGVLAAGVEKAEARCRRRNELGRASWTELCFVEFHV